MPHLNRRGFTLVELLVALLLLGIVTAAVHEVLINNQRTYHAQTVRVDLQQDLRAAITILPAEFRELDASDGDIQAMATDSIRIRAPRQFGVMCVPPMLGGGMAGTFIVLRNELLVGPGFAAGDSLLLYHEGDEASRDDDAWALGTVRTSPSAQACPDGRAGTRLDIDFAAFDPPLTDSAGAIPVGGTVRGFEVTTYKSYQAADGLWYLGVSTAASTLQPLIGPLAGRTALRFNYYDAGGAVTTIAAQVAEIEILLRVRSARPIQLPHGGRLTPLDSIATRVALRNNPRF